MAIYNEILAPRYARLLQKLFGIKGEVPTKQLSGEIIAVQPLFVGTEQRILEQWRIWAQSQSVAASAGNLSAARFRNPSTSNVVACIEKILITTVTAGSPGIAIDFVADPGANLATLRSPQPRDMRVGTTGSSVLICSDGNPAAQTAGDQQLLFFTGTTGVNWDAIWPPEQEIVIPPGFALEIYSLLANSNLVYNVFWRERALEESERTPLV